MHRPLLQTVFSPLPDGARSACRTSAAICAWGRGNDSAPTPSTSTFGIGTSIVPLTKKSPCLVAVAQLEKRTDLLLSTLQRYVRAAGAELSLVVHTKQGADIVLQSLGDLAGRGNAGAKPGRAKSGGIAKRGALGRAR